MIKAIVIIILIFNLLACQPVSKDNKVGVAEKPFDFVCLKSQSQCEVNTQYGRFSIKFSADVQHKYVKTELPFHIQLSFDSVEDNYQITETSSFLEGKTMFMGKVPVFFERDVSNEKNEANTMIAESLLASCTEEIMTWRLWFQIEILADDVIHQQDFFIEFESERL